MNSRKIDLLKTRYDRIICGFSLSYLSQTHSQKFITDCYSLLNENGLIYIGFVEGDPDKSDFQVGCSGDRIYFYFYNLDDLIERRKKNNFDHVNVFKMEYRKTENEFGKHTILIAIKITNH